MAEEERTDPVPPSGNDQCVFCRLTNQFHAWRSHVLSSNFQDGSSIHTLGRAVVDLSVGVCHRGVSFSRGLYYWVVPPLRDQQDSGQPTEDSRRHVLDIFRDYSVIFFLYGLVALLFAILIFMPRAPNEDLQVYVLAMLFPMIFFWLPCYCWRNGLFDLFKSTSSQGDGEASQPQMVTEKPPEYESLMFPGADPVLSYITPPTYEEAVHIPGESQISSPEYSRDTSEVVLLCPVHQQSNIRQPVVAQDMSVQRSGSLGDLRALDTNLLA